MIIVIGESCTDIYVYTKSTRLSPEAPVPVLIPTHKVKAGGDLFIRASVFAMDIDDMELREMIKPGFIKGEIYR